MESGDSSQKSTSQQPQVVALTDSSVEREADWNGLITNSVCILLAAILAN